MTEKRNIVTFTLSASLFSLAGALVYFTIEFSQVATQIPTILASINQTSEKIKPVVSEINEIRNLIPSIVNEVSEIRKQIPPLLEEVKQTRELIPSVVEEVKQSRKLVPPILEEAKKIRKVIPAILKEVKNTREAMPGLLGKASEVVSNARLIGKDATEGAVSGVITGIIKAPFKLIGGLSSSVLDSLDIEDKDITKEDRELSITTAKELLLSETVGEARNWSNSNSGNKGSVTFKAKKVLAGRNCRILLFVIDKKNVKKEVTVCLNDASEWELIEQ